MSKNLFDGSRFFVSQKAEMKYWQGHLKRVEPSVKKFERAARESERVLRDKVWR